VIPASSRTKIAFATIGGVVLMLGATAFSFAIPTTALAQTAPTSTAATASSAETTAQKQQALENQLTTLEGQIDQYESQITADEAKGTSLTSTINGLNAQIAKVKLQIQATNLTLQQINGQITATTAQISTTQSDIADKKRAVATLLQALYESDGVSPVESFLENPQIADLWDEIQNISLFETDLTTDVTQLNTLTGQLQDQNQQLAASQTAAASAAAYEAAQAAQIASTKTQESQLLTQTKGQESTYQTLVTQTKQTAAQIRNQIFQLLGGGSLTFEQAYQYAQVASQATGVQAPLIMAVLDRESALGQNVGQCGYKTAMSPSNIPIFLQITSQLGLNPDEMMVSCPNADGVYGGAMGPAQFEPSTWELYTSGIEQITGDNPPSPWSNADAFVATALYLKGAMQGCVATYSATVAQERCTAAKYYAGGNWKNYLWTYGEAIVEQAQTFTQDIATITSS
jgi:membrane-bound lytic murein transglycosylase B/peptidoglycan hydrolase CwlO-like protein